MTLYIKIDEDGNPVDFPITEENIEHYFEFIGPITPESLKEHGFAELINGENPGLGIMPQYEVLDIVRTNIVKNPDGTIEQKWIVQELSNHEKMRRWVLPARGYKLLMSDWTQVADSPLSDEEKASWRAYRAALRDMTDTDLTNIKDIAEISWPEAPGQLSSSDSKWLPEPPIYIAPPSNPDWPDDVDPNLVPLTPQRPAPASGKSLEE